MGMRLMLGAVAILLLLSAIALGDKIIMKDGSVLEGTVIPQSDGYWYKSEDGAHRHIDASEVDRVERTGGKINSSSGPSAAMPSNSLARVKRRVAELDSSLAAVSLWQQFIDSNPSDEDLKSARQELARWKKLQEAGAEKINGRWVGGRERQAILEKSVRLQAEGLELMKKKQTLQAITRFEEAQAAYPNSFESAFWLGYIMMVEHDAEKATRYFNQALKLDPNSAEAMANLALLQLDKRQFAEAASALYKAALKGDTPEIAQDLITVLSFLPLTQRTSDRFKPAVDAANLLASQYQIKAPGPILIVPLHESREEPPPGSMTSGSGIIISANGLILTNRHVAEKSKSLTVLVDGKGEKVAEVVSIDDEQDLALLRIKADDKLPVATLSPNDSPPQGAECTALGFPLADRFGTGIKLTRGVVSSKGDLKIGADVMVDAKINPGNSGGPMLDKYGNVMAIVVMKSVSIGQNEDSYGFGISAGQIRKFLTKNHVKLEDGKTGPMALNTEQIAAKVTPSVVCILATH